MAAVDPVAVHTHSPLDHTLILYNYTNRMNIIQRTNFGKGLKEAAAFPVHKDRRNLETAAGIG
jgi:hypothetical protein